MVIEDIPDWARDENDPPKRMWEKPAKTEDEKIEPDKEDVTETDAESKVEEEDPVYDEDGDPEDTVNEEDSEGTPEEDTEESDEDEDEEDDETEPEDDKDHGFGPFVEGLYNATEETDDDEESEGDPDEDDNEDEDEEDHVVDITDDDELPPSKDTIPLEATIVDEDVKNEENKTSLNHEKGTEVPPDAEKPLKKRSTRSFKYSFKNWLNGTPENPLPLFSLRAKFKRWRLIHYHNHVWLRIMSYDKEKNEYIICENLIPRNRLPKTAVHCTNEKNVYFDKLFNVPYEPWKDHGFGAMNAYLYMKDTSIDEALLLLWKNRPINMRTVMIIGIIAVSVMFYFFYMMQG